MDDTSNSEVQNDQITICVVRTSQAYKSWLKNKGRARRNDVETSDKLFIREIERQIRSVGDDVPSHTGLPRSTSSWSEWGTGKRSPTKLIKRSVCNAIFVLTGVDVSVDRQYRSRPVNLTDVAIVTEFSGRRISNAPTEENERYELSVKNIHLQQSHTIDVTVEWVDRKSNSIDRDLKIGTVKWALREAVLEVSGVASSSAKIVALSSGQETENGTSNGLNLIEDARAQGRWRIQTSITDTLHGVLSDLVLAETECPTGSEIDLTISATEADIAYGFRFDGARQIDVSDLQRAKEQLVARMLAIKLSEQSSDGRRLLSRASLFAE